MHRFTRYLMLILAGFLSLSLFWKPSLAEDMPGTVTGVDWSLTPDGVLTLRSNAGWQDFLRNGESGWYWLFIDNLPERVQKLVIGKNVTKFSIYEPSYMNKDDMYETDYMLIRGNDAFMPYIGIYYQHPKFMPVTIAVEAGNPVFYMKDGMLINRDKQSVVLSERLKSDVVIPNGIKSIETWAFYCREITSVTFPDTLKTIGGEAFSECEALESIELPNSVTSVEVGAFSHCFYVTHLVLSENLQSIEMGAFANCGMEEITIPNGIKQINFLTFFGCDGLKRVNLPEGLKRIENYAFDSCENLEEISLPSGLQYIGMGAFERCFQLKHMVLPESLQEIGESAFDQCKFAVLQVPSRLKILAIPENERGFSTALSFDESTRTFGMDSVDTILFTGSDYDFGAAAVDRANQVIFLGKPPQNMASYLNEVDSGTIYYLDDYAQDWKAVSQAEWGKWSLVGVTRKQVEQMVDRSIHPTPEPTAEPTPVPTPAPVYSPTPTFFYKTNIGSTNPDANADSEQSKQGGLFSDPVVLGMGVGILLVVAGLAIIASRTLGTKRKKTKK